MAERNAPKKPASAKAPARKSSTVTVTNRSDAGKSRSTKDPKSTKSSAAERRAEAERAAAKKAAKNDKKTGFMRNYMPYILGAVALFLAVCFVVDLFGRDVTDPVDHPMGVFGYYICYALFGCLSWVAYLIPAVLATLTVFWQRYFRTGKVISKVILSVLLLLLLASLTHVIICAADPDMAEVLELDELFETGAAFESGGVIGGLLGYLLFLALRLPGTIVLTVITLPLIIMCLVGVTPRDVFLFVWNKVRTPEEEREARREEKQAERDERRAEKRAARAAKESEDDPDDDIDDYEDEDEAPARPAKNPARRTARATRAADEEDDRADNDPDGEDLDEDRPTDRRKGRRAILVDSDTGEVLGKADKSEKTADGEEKIPTLRLHDPDPVAKPERARDDEESIPERKPLRREAEAPVQAPVRRDEAPAPDEDDAPWVETTAAETAPPSIADRYRAHDYDDDEDEDNGTDTLEVGFDDEPEDLEEPDDSAHLTPPTRISGRRVSYEVVTDPELATHTGNATTDVRILKSETAAVAERGLSEEEIVLPSFSGTAAEEPTEEAREYIFPDIDMLTRGPSQYATNDEEIAENTQILRDVLESFRIGVREISCSCGPTITRFEVKPDTGVRVRSIANLVDDIAMGLAKAGVRIEAPIPGKSAVGIEVPNAEPSNVYLRNILETPEFRNHKSRIAACLGADVSGRPVILDINKMPHLLIAGATGTGKSVCINSLIMSILYKAKPDEVKLILIDPKKVEFAMYRDLPHLYAPVVSDPKKAAGALNSAVNEMERRFELIEEVGVRNLAGYNEITAGDPERPPLPQMVIIIDELADLMMTAPAEVETAICRLAQKARAAGIHLIIGTQRPSVDVITGLIKANVPSRIAFTVKSGVDSRTILDTVGADKLIGRGDMLYAPIGCNKPIRAQGCFVSETEVEKVVTFIKEHNDGPEYNEDFARSIDLEAAKCGGKKKGEQMAIDDFDSIGGGGGGDGEDPKFWEALEIAVTKDKIGTSALQRGCNLGYGRAAKIIDRMEELGFVGPDPGTKQGRKVLITKQDLIQYKLNGLPGSHESEDADDEE